MIVPLESEAFNPSGSVSIDELNFLYYDAKK